MAVAWRLLSFPYDQPVAVHSFSCLPSVNPCLSLLHSPFLPAPPRDTPIAPDTTRPCVINVLNRCCRFGEAQHAVCPARQPRVSGAAVRSAALPIPEEPDRRCQQHGAHPTELGHFLMPCSAADGGCVLMRSRHLQHLRVGGLTFKQPPLPFCCVHVRHACARRKVICVR